MTTNNDTLCVQCGLCCDGTLFYGARLKPDDDRAVMDREGVRVLESSRQFSLPCPCLVDKKCRIYEERFSTCRSFRCRLLKEVEAGTTPMSDAVAVVRTATALGRAVRHALVTEGVSPGLALSTAVARWRAESDSASESGKRLELLYGALRALIASRFANPR